MHTFWWSIDPLTSANRFYTACDSEKLEAAFTSHAPSCILDVSKAFLKQDRAIAYNTFCAAAFRKIHRGFQVYAPDQL